MTPEKQKKLKNFLQDDEVDELKGLVIAIFIIFVLFFVYYFLVGRASAQEIIETPTENILVDIPVEKVASKDSYREYLDSFNPDLSVITDRPKGKEVLQVDLLPLEKKIDKRIYIYKKSETERIARIYSYDQSEFTWIKRAFALSTSTPIFDDTYLQKASPTENQGTNTDMWCHYVSASILNNCILRFFIPDLGDSSISAIHLFLYANGGVGDGDFSAHKMTQPAWVESEATWNIYATSNNWATAGGDYDVSALSTVTAPASGWTDFNITGSATTSSTTVNIAVIKSNTTYGYTPFASVENTTTTIRPYVDITYTVNTPTSTTTATTTDIDTTGIVSVLQALLTVISLGIFFNVLTYFKI